MGALIFGYDKLCAKMGKNRIRERFLMTFALCMGAVGAWCGMYLFRHKTAKPKFKFGIPALVVLNAVAVIAVYKLF